MELALCLAIITAVITGMSLYIKRSFQAKYKGGADYLISTIKKEGGHYGNIRKQYDPYYATSNITETRNGVTKAGFPESSVDMTTKIQGWRKTDSVQNAD